MNFVDRTGHLFNLPSYNDYPIGYEYQEYPYVFWIESDNSQKLSIDNYYFKPIRIVTKVEEETYNIKIMLENSNKFYLVDSDIIDNKLLNINNINDTISIFENDILNSKLLEYTENIDLSDINNSHFKGTLVEETEKLTADKPYYTAGNSIVEYTGDIYHIYNLPEDVNFFIDKNGNQVTVIRDISGTHFQDFEGNDISSVYLPIGKVKIGILEKYIELTKKYRNYIFDNTETEESLINQGYENINTKKELYLINSFYVVVNSHDAGTWKTNALIQVNNEYCPITIGAEIVDECEELIINGKNLGINLPKDITKAIYSSNYNMVVADEETYNKKLKEYLLNYISLKGGIGNYKNAINSLKWFEWGNKLSLSKLLKNDNQVQNQYIKDFFDIFNDHIYSYTLFKETSLMNLELRITEEIGQEKQNLKDAFWGEGKPILKNKINDLIEIKYDEEEYIYYKGYFNFTFNDLALKLIVLKYYYEKYFLPIHIKLKEAYISQQVFMNDIKFIAKTSHGITANPVYISTNTVYNIFTENNDENNQQTIIFNENNYNIIYLSRYYKKYFNKMYSENNKLYVDENFNEFSNYTQNFVENNYNTYYEINDTCLRIPIDFCHNGYYNVNLILSRYINKDNEDTIIETYDKEGNLLSTESNLYQLFESSFKFIQTDNKKYQSLIIYPKIINEKNQRQFDLMYWLNNKFRIDLIVNGILYNFIFTVKMPEFNIEMGKLQYKYDDNFKQIKYITDSEIKFNTYMYLPNLVTVNNINFDEEIMNLSNNISEYINSKYKEKIKFINKKYLNISHLFKLTDSNNNEIQYNSNNEIELYKTFFNNDGTYKFDESILNINGEKYDFYLMHDSELKLIYENNNPKLSVIKPGIWYIIFISQEPSDQSIKNNFSFKNGNKETILNGYKIKYERSDKKMLLNRFIYIPTGGINHFTTEDIIVASLKNNDKLSFKLAAGSKWSIYPLTADITDKKIATSNTELAIISINDEYSDYEKGYYSIAIEYSIDNVAEHIFTKRVKFRID